MSSRTPQPPRQGPESHIEGDTVLTNAKIDRLALIANILGELSLPYGEGFIERTQDGANTAVRVMRLQ